ncbi:MAG: V-type ATP synthase subunit D [Erysipelotrichaceae bacterium]|uniref:V-type ATP synthase subunit D n=2 Tax=Galactobacillus timonensis TaxID=2041840 RepID=UPI000C82A5F9|nr:V-type ATP synthase subunit D [Galactobacillus timonensis]MDY6281710.1 V-type ATP synthase subunit D [Erysipelotrichaceae bacterium]
MSTQIAATKGNLIRLKRALKLSQSGYELMDRKRNILISEMMKQADQVKLVRDQIADAYRLGYYLLEQANLYTGQLGSVLDEISIETGIQVTYRSVMGVEVPHVIWQKPDEVTIPYGLESTNSRIDEAYIQFQKVKELTMVLAEVDSSVYRLADAISKTQKRANALKNIVIPRYEAEIREISDQLEEKEREEFSRMKVIKASKPEAQA